MTYRSRLFDRFILASTALVALFSILMSVQTMASAQAFERLTAAHVYTCETDSDCARECLAFEPQSDCTGNRIDRSIASTKTNGAN